MNAPFNFLKKGIYAAQDVSNDEGYVVSTGYDDGIEYNQEANLFVQLYDGYDSYISIDIQMVATDDGSMWYREWAGGDSGDRDHPTREVSFEEPSNIYRTPEGKVVRAKFQTNGCRCVMYRRGGSAGCMLDQALSDAWSVCMTTIELCVRRTWVAMWPVLRLGARERAACRLVPG